MELLFVKAAASSESPGCSRFRFPIFFFFWEMDQIMQHFVLWGTAGRGEDLISWRLRKSMFTACTNLTFNNRT